MSNPGEAFATAAKRLLKSPVGIALILAAAGSATFGFAAGAAAVIVGGCVIYAIMVAQEANRDSSGLVGMPHEAELDTASRVRLRAILRLQAEIEAMMDGHRDHPVVSAVSEDARSEVNDVLRRSVEILQARRKVSRLAGGIHKARIAVAELNARLAEERDERARLSTEAALAARREELRNFEQLALAEKRLNANLDEAESTLAELRSQIALTVADPEAQPVDYSARQLPEITRRLRQLSTTMAESIETVSQRGW